MPALVRLLDFGVLSPAAELAATTSRYFDRSGICKGPLQHVFRVRVLPPLCKDKKTGGDFKEIDLLGRQIERLARVRCYQEPGGNEADMNSNVDARNAGSKDEFFSIKNVTRDDALAAHRVPPQLLGLVPTGTTGFGSVVPAAQVFAINELLPLMTRFQQLNDWLGEEVVEFGDYAVTNVDGNGAKAAD
ncbi:hypothetical protein SAMN05216570_0961 [Dyella sp. OK004]|uniref:hypothetical protein n=1 Tax=Dyella sp. OK004 TaxID=1855292 RepID=UPI0008DF3C1A|nr:hypothetical protein [Dyella sp. OK004]SFR94289.1 hypothetical protein SAMN05216570_0961 [Dyella sp. OK004]